MASVDDKTVSKATPLSGVQEGSRVRLAALECGKGMALRLASMGIRAGMELDVLRAAGCGPVIVGVGHCRIALGRGVTHRMMVTPLERSR